MTRTITELMFQFTGLYGWGTGWDANMRMRWNDYWMNHVNCAMWHFWYRTESYGTVEQLVGTGKAVYLHPLTTNAVIDASPTDMQVTSLIRLMRECAEFCGVQLQITKRVYTATLESEVTE